MKNFLVISFIFFTFFINSYSKIYIGAGANYLIPLSDFKELNENSLGINLEIMNKNFCKLWYGLRFDYIPLEKKSEIINNYERIIALSLSLKYAPFTEDCYDNKLIPFIAGNFGICSIKPNQFFINPGSSVALGGSIGIGLNYNFKLFRKCWMIELEGLYYAPNSIERASQRENLQSINVGLKLSMGL